MKRKYLIAIIGLFFLFSCEDDFLEKQPLTSVSPETFFKKADDFKIYVNQFYDLLGDPRNPDDDLNTDVQIGINPDQHLNGETVKPVADGSWTNGYSNIRKVNIALNASTEEIQWDDVKAYVGEARFFRAWEYFKLLKRFGGVPWINEPLTTEDRDKLVTPRSPRNVIADSIVVDLDFAIANLPSKTKAQPSRLNKETALAFKSRMCLYEGTWEKYHGKENTPFQVSGSNGAKYLQMAADAALQVINSGIFSINKTGDEPYNNLFIQEDYTSNNEVILWRKYDRSIKPNNRSRAILDGIITGGLTKKFIEDYLATDGLPMSLTNLPLGDDSLTLVIQNRDPRLAQTIYYPGVPGTIDAAGNHAYYSFPDLLRSITGYQYRKGGSPSIANVSSNNVDQTAYIYFRYAEVLLNYIEAKAELNESNAATLTQNDFDISINKLRDRVGMPHFNFNVVITDPDDPFTGKIPWYLVEIRRERSVELAVEGFRMNDLFRWAAIDELIKNRIFLGAPIQWYLDRGFYAPGEITGVNGDGILSPWHGQSINSNGGYGFNLNRDYLYPIPSEEEVLAGYENNPGWE